MCETCGTGSRFSFETLTAEATLDEATGAQGRRESWHFHMFSPNCIFNPQAGVYTLMVEFTDQRRNVCVMFEERPVEVNKVLLAMLHGEGALDEKGSDDEAGGMTPEEEALLASVSAAVAAGRNWHHHMMFPICTLNTAEGKWRLSVEIEGSEEPAILDSDAEPSLLLNRLERIYFGLA